MISNSTVSQLIRGVTFVIISIYLNSCAKDPTIPVLITESATDITANSVTISAEITDDGRAEVTARGFCWGTAQNPTINDDFIPSGTGTGAFSSTIDGLEPNTEYNVRAFAENSVGIAYGNEVTFVTSIGTPAVSTEQVTDITSSSAACGGTIISDGGASITERGLCWSTSADPDINDNHTSTVTGTESFYGTMTGLQPATFYYARAYVKNDAYTVYGEVLTFYTRLSDVEGNLYRIVPIGDQLWMAENIKTTRLNDNTLISNLTDNTEWIGTNAAAYCWYNNDIANKSLYGALYNWYTVETGKICPSGWHVPTDDEFSTLEQTLGMASDQLTLWGWRGTDQATQMKNTTGWDEGGNGTNSSGFSALPGGYRFGVDGSFYLITTITYWWTETEHDADRGWYRRLDASSGQVYRASTSKKGGKYVRCVKN